MGKFKEHVKNRLNNKFFLIVFLIYFLLCLSSAIYFISLLQIRNSLLSFFFILFVPIILLLEFALRVRCGEILTIALLFLAFSGILGSCYDLYSVFPKFDTILHGVAGFIFACVGFSLAEKIFKKGEDKTNFFSCLIFAVCFSLAIAVLWELFEYFCTVCLNFDMMEDQFVNEINSYVLSGSHAKIITLENISKTIIQYGNGQTYVIDGYLDLGLMDTLDDLIICTLGAVLFILVSTFSHFRYKKIIEILIPQSILKNEKIGKLEFQK